MATSATTSATTPAGRLRATARRVPDRDALRWQDRRVTYGELDAAADAAAVGLAGLGVGRGDRVAIVLPNVPAFVEAWYGVLRRGAVAVPVAPVLAPDELRHVLADAEATVVVVGATLVDVVSAQRDQLPALRHVVAATPDDAAFEAADTTWSAVLADGRTAAGDRDTVGAAGFAAGDDAAPDDVAALVYTSGTTGRPRGAMLTVDNLVTNQDQSLAGRLRLEQEDVVLGVLPLFHIYGLNVVLGPAVAVGATVVLHDRFDAAATAALVADEGITVVPGAPPMYVAWARQPPNGQLDGVRLFASGAAPLARRTAERFAAGTGAAIREGYGLTEAGPAVTSTAMADEVRYGSVGLPLPGVELRLVDDDQDVAPGDPGEVWVRGRNVFAGYWHDEEATHRALTADGWLRTGDVGILDDDGWLHLVDRRTDLILVSGFNVYPREVERVLLAHPAVAAAAVVGAPHPVTGETPVAHVVPSGGPDLVEAELDEHCRTHLARYKCPTGYRVESELPETLSGKVRRTELRLD